MVTPRVPVYATNMAHGSAMFLVGVFVLGLLCGVLYVFRRGLPVFSFVGSEGSVCACAVRTAVDRVVSNSLYSFARGCLQIFSY